MLNVYRYHTSPKSLNAPSQQMADSWKKDAMQKRENEMEYLESDLRSLMDDYDVRIAYNTAPDGKWTASAGWGYGRRLSFYIPPDDWILHITENGRDVQTYDNPFDIVNVLADSLHEDGAFAQQDDDDDDGWEDDNWAIDDDD